MPPLRDAIRNAMIMGTRRNYLPVEMSGEGLYGGMLVDRYPNCGGVMAAGRKRKPRAKKAGMLVDRYPNCRAGVMAAGRKRKPRAKKGAALVDKYIGYGRRPRALKGSKTARKPRAKKGGAKSNYIAFVKAWQRQNPGYTWLESMRMASADYHKSAKAAANKVGLGVMAAGRKPRPARRRVVRR